MIDNNHFNHLNHQAGLSKKFDDNCVHLKTSNCHCGLDPQSHEINIGFRFGARNDEYIEGHNYVFCNIFVLVILLQVSGMFLSPIVINSFNLNIDWYSINRVWDIICLTIMFFAIVLKCRKVKLSPWLIAFIYLVTQLITIIIYSDNLLNNVKTIGLNTNIIAVVINIIIYYSLLYDKCFTENQVYNLLKIIYGIGCFSVIYSAITEYEALLLAYSPNIGAYSAYVVSFYEHKNFFGPMLFFSIIAGFYLYMHKKKKTYLIGIIIQLLFFIATFSRAALLMLVIFIILYIFFDDKYKRSVKITTIIFVISILSIYYLNEATAQFINNKVIREQYGDTGRFDFWLSTAYELSKYNTLTRIIFGIGYAEFDAIGSSYVHNAYLEVFYVGGLIKIAFFIISIIYLLKLNLSVRKINTVYNNLGLYTLLCYLAYALFESKTLYHLGLIQFLFIIYIHLIPQMLHNNNLFQELDTKAIKK